MPALTEEDIRLARKQVAQTRIPFTEVLAESTGHDQRELAPAVATIAHLRYLSMSDIEQLQPAFDVLNLEQLIQRQVLLLRDEGGHLLAALPDPFNSDVIDGLRAKILEPVTLCFALHSDIMAYISRQEAKARTVEQIVQQHGSVKKEVVIDLSYAAITNENNAAVKFVNSTLYDALKSSASDIHIETTGTGLNVKYRIDGVLDQITAMEGTDLAEQVISRIKVLAELDIAERRIPQDGSLSVMMNDREIDLRISVMPSIHGEDIVIRILDKRAMIAAHGALNLPSLGFSERSLEQIRQLASQAYGMLLVTGPTGSGKTTTLYAALTEIHTGKEKIITIEDPVEYQLPGILQIPVNERKGLTFAKGLRSILRHDPDIIMVGEIRDKDTAEIAVQSALTGHLVFTTVHANSVFDVFGRFTHMGIDLYAFVSSLNGIVAQRLIRKNCTHCAKPYTPTTQEIRLAALTPDQVPEFKFMKGEGCGDCRGTGFKGRKAIAEILILNDEIRELIINRSSIRHIKDAAAHHGTLSLRDTALSLVMQGETTLEEIRKVILHV
ncbi:type II/IV secretion system protein [Undibacterium sp. LX15W]|uniref:Type II/IV secretion system protein n=2 Tax=Undibacterium flavidum TaxID=2762297 RepID=A0ABR6YEE5_9BURK|nr:type II/IV secretion system protein [Undibacterium flavidum]